MSQNNPIEHIFRHEYGRLVALLTRRTAFYHFELVEDSVQWAMTQAVELWCRDKMPNSPAAWLYKVAYNHLLSELKASQRKQSLLTEYLSTNETGLIEPNEIPFDSEMNDSMLRMLFSACDVSIPIESQLVFTLKSLCGFSITEISLRLFISEANVYKRYSRAKKHLKTKSVALDNLTENDMAERLPSVLHVLYLTFTEGYLSSHEDLAIRIDLCEEAIRMARLLVVSHIGYTPDSHALLALMYFHLARMPSRQDEYGALLLLEQQARSKWDQQQTTTAMAFLAQSADGDTISRYHIEAGIAAEHCLSPSFNQTRWDKIVASYELLERVAPSPIHILSRALAVAEWKGPKEGLAVLKSATIPHWLSNSYHWYTVQADLLFRSGKVGLSQKYAERAIELAPSNSIKKLLSKRLIHR